ncbi:VWA domain-containing protein [Candidatus Woesearchaeota archaeon]|nr:VWA domain-containing protein [Candidatus Woesearchaeota archaeon]
MITRYIERPEILFAIIILAVLILFLLKKQFITIKEDAEAYARKKKIQRVLFITRTVLCLLLLIGLASPYINTEKTIEGDPVIKILIDNSSSMTALEKFDTKIIEELKKKTPVEVRTIAQPEISDIGEAVLSSLGAFESALLVSDGNVNKGANLADVAVLARQINSSVNAIKLSTKEKDSAVTIQAPEKTTEDVDTEIKVSVTGNNIPTRLTIDGNPVYDGTLTGTTAVTRKLKQGYHKITATINNPDFFQQNNNYLKTIKTVKPVKTLFLTEKGETQILSLLRQAYNIEPVSQLPENLEDYYTIIMDDIPASNANKHVEKLTQYLTEGNGILVIGGKNSYENGQYRNSLFEKLLPVNIGRPQKREGDMNVVIVIDISGSTGAGFGRAAKAVDVEKAMAIDIIANDISADTKVGIVAFNTQAFTISDIDYLGSRYTLLEDRIARLQDGGGTLIGLGLIKALEMLDTVHGSKNIILVSDGRTQAENVAMEATKLAANNGVRIYTIGVGDITNEETMIAYAEATGGVYFKAKDASNVKILFGNPEEEKSNEKTIVVLNKNHELTQGLENTSAKITGYNQVSPKTTGQMLLATSDGIPVLTIGRVGLGRMAVLSTDDGTSWAGELLSTKNSPILTRTIDWTIGEPDRKEKELVIVHDTRIKTSTPILVKSEKQPVAQGYNFVKTTTNTYTSTITPENTGFQEILGAIFAVNAPSEYDTIGQNPTIELITRATGGELLNQNDAEGILKSAKARAKRTLVTREYIRWPFILGAIIILLLEIFIRRLLRSE